MINAWEKLNEDIVKKFTNRFPVPVVDIANALNIKVYETNSFSDKQSGSIAFDGTDFIIYINQSHAPTRKAFSIAHEIGHFLLHPEKVKEASELITDSRTLTPNGGLKRSEALTTSSDEARIEREANEFAASLLMPEEEFKERFEQAKDISEVASHFAVSQSAATIRAQKLLGQFFT